MLRRLLILILLCSFFAGISCARRANVNAVEKLRLRLVTNQFDELYDDSSSVTRARLSKQDFIVEINRLADSLKAIDPEIKWQRNETLLYDPGVNRDDNFSSMDLESRGKKVNVQINWEGSFQFCGIQVISELNDGTGVGFRHCD